MAAKPRDHDNLLGLLDDPRSSHRVPSMPEPASGEQVGLPPALRGNGWGQQRRQVNASASGSSWNIGAARTNAAGSTETAKSWGRGDIDCGVWNTTSSSDDGWPTCTANAEEKQGEGWTSRNCTDDDATMKGSEKGELTVSTSCPKHKHTSTCSRLYAFNAKISGQPCSCLITVFGSNEDTKLIQISKDSNYTVWEVDHAMSRRKNAKFKFAGIFTNPVDGEHFIGGRSGGKWKGAQYELVEVPSINEQTVLLPCYSSKANARHSAAARALDCISFRSTNGEETYGMCIDQPYLDPADAPSLPRSAPVSNSTSTCDSMMAEDEAPLDVSAAVIGDQNASPPKALLQRYYQERYLDFVSINKYLFNYDNGDAHHRLHTSVFVDPTNCTERFACGRLIGNGKSPSYEVSLEECHSGESVEVVWYRRKKDAENAAAARALDCISLRRSLENGSVPAPLLCSENPYSNAADAPPLSLRSQLEVETAPSEEHMPIISNRKVRPMPMETEAEVAHRQEYRMSRMP